MRKKKKYTMAVGTYFFIVKMGYNNKITVSRKTKEEAEYAYGNYIKQKKKLEWLGQWDGKKFIDSDYQAAA